MQFSCFVFTSRVNAPFWLVLSDVRQGMFFAVLVCFWLVFTGEHMIDGEGRSANRVYWPRLLLVAGSSAALFIFELAERGVQIRNPFYRYVVRLMYFVSVLFPLSLTSLYEILGTSSLKNSAYVLRSYKIKHSLTFWCM